VPPQPVNSANCASYSDYRPIPGAINPSAAWALGRAARFDGAPYEEQRHDEHEADADQIDKR